MKKAVYIADLNLPSKRAYAVHVFKMCDNFSLNKFNVKLLVINEKAKTNYKKLKKDYLLRSRNNFSIYSIFKKKNYIGSFHRIFFGFKSAIYVKNHNADIILTRSIWSSIFMIFFKIKHILEIHNTYNGISGLIVKLFNLLNSKYVQNIIFISTELSKLFSVDKKKIIILHDGVDIKNFKLDKIRYNFKPKNVCYVGSFYEGRGIDIIIYLSKKFKDINFNLYGDNNKFKNKTNGKNLKFNGYYKYKEIPKILRKNDILLMPYKKIVSVDAGKLNTANYCSPLKLFEYLAAGKIIISSNLKGINEVLTHKKNALICKSFSKEGWGRIMKKIIKSEYEINKIRENALNTAKYYTWDNRVKKIMKIASIKKF